MPFLIFFHSIVYRVRHFFFDTHNNFIWLQQEKTLKIKERYSLFALKIINNQYRGSFIVHLTLHIHVFLRSHSKCVARLIYFMFEIRLWIGLKHYYAYSTGMWYTISNIQHSYSIDPIWWIYCRLSMYSCVSNFDKMTEVSFPAHFPLFHSLWRLYRSTNDVPFINIRCIDKCFMWQSMQHNSRL